jgi:hypothetical protein
MDAPSVRDSPGEALGLQRLTGTKDNQLRQLRFVFLCPAVRVSYATTNHVFRDGLERGGVCAVLV